MTIEQTVIKHYARKNIADSILAQARERAEEPETLKTSDLAAFDEMHIGGVKATAHLIDRLGLTAGMSVLDVGCGIGGPARYVAETTGAAVTGVDLTPEYKAVGEALNKAVGLAGNPEFVTGNATAMPFDEGAFDAAYLIHAGMNIQDKQALCRDVFRVLKPGALFGIYDVMGGQETEQMAFPVPWADTQGSSFLLRPRDVEAILVDAGFEIVETESRCEFGVAALDNLLQHHIEVVREDTFRPKAMNLKKNIENGYCVPWQIVARKS
ncbi:MAG: class I SAM-dependent methyltransferase [Rhodospirillales bacterium]|nr:class I SAM-dependent methyltransferase [Rhodospirillales bacterium]MCB9995353.1 class I SAM-dependent methyltransferase [Rhodospirillales bacterium]